MREAQAAHRALDDVPTLPCRIHHASDALTDLAQVAYDLYVMLSQDRQFQYRERQKGRKRSVDVLLDYPATMRLIALMVDECEEQQEVFRLVRMIHATVYPSSDDEA